MRLWARTRNRPACECDGVVDLTNRVGTNHVVTLVHGTFARHATWLRRGQPLRDALEKSGADVRVFCWSGKNVQADREQAGRELRAHLRTIEEQRPGSAQTVVAHSHGGNVALYALRDEPGDPAPDARVVTLATPFLSLHPAPKVSLFTLYNIVALAFVGPLLALSMLFLTSTDLDGTAESAETEVPVGVTAAGLVIGAIALGTFLASAWAASRSADGSWWREIRGHTIRRTAARITPPRLGPDQLLVVRGAGDEASSLLGATHLIGWLGHRIVLGFARARMWHLRYWLLGVGYLVVLLLAAIVHPVVANIVVWPVAIAALIVTLGNLPFGADTLHLSVSGRLRAEAIPLGPSTVVQVTDDDRNTLVHGVYEHPDAIRHVVEFVGATPATRGTVTTF